MVVPSTRRLRLRLRHVAALLGLAVPAGPWAMIYFAGGVDPNLAGARGSWSGLTPCCGRRLCRRWVHWAARRRALAPRLNTAVAATGSGTFCAGERRAVLAGSRYRASALPLDRARSAEIKGAAVLGAHLSGVAERAV
jgi:hypothetical protein